MTVDRSDAVNLARNMVQGECGCTPAGSRILAEAVLRMDEALKGQWSSWDSGAGGTMAAGRVPPEEVDPRILLTTISNLHEEINRVRAERASPEEASAPMSCRAFSGPEQFAAYCVAKGQREERSEWSVAYDLWLKELSRYMNKSEPT